MNLTRTDKQAFVRAIMDDVPTVNFYKQAMDLLREEMVKAMPEKLKAVYLDPELRKYLRSDQFISVPGLIDNTYMVIDFEISPEVKERVIELGICKKKQADDRNNLEKQMKALIEPIRTLKKAKELLPEELHKYLPADRDSTGVANLPALSNPITLLKNAGWPKAA